MFRSVVLPASALALLVVLAPNGAQAARSDSGTPRAMQGPMLGRVTPTSILVWLRVSGEFPVAIEYSESADFSDSTTTDAITAREAGDLTVVVPIEGLEPATTYHYRPLINGQTDRYRRDEQFTFTTAPDGPAAFRFGFGSCARTQESPDQPIWHVVGELDPDLFIWLGDNVYGDSLIPAITAEEYRRQFAVPAFRPIMTSVPQLAVWDDHDYGLNDHDGTNPVKVQLLEVFKRHWPNGSYGLPDAPGVFFRYAYGGVDFFFTDGRYYRTPNTEPDGPEKTLLGEAQLAWLKEGLRESEAVFKLVLCGSGWTKAKGMGGDSWASFIHERDALFAYIRDNAISGVVLLSGDTHTGECNAIPLSDEGGYDLYDLVSSPLAQDGNDAWRNREPEVRLRPGYEAANVGLVEIDTTVADPTLRFNVYGEDGSAAWEPLVIRASELQNGVESYATKVRYNP